MQTRATGVLVVLLLGGAAAAKADILFNDYGPTDTYNTNNGWTVAGSAVPGSNAPAMEFTPLMTEAVSSVDFGLSLGLPVGTNSRPTTLWRRGAAFGPDT